MGRRTTKSVVGLHNNGKSIDRGNSFLLGIRGRISDPLRDMTKVNDQRMREELDLLREKREEAHLRIAAYKQKTAQYFN